MNPFFILLKCFAGLLMWLPLPFLLILDLVTEIYHRVSFPILGIPKVKRRRYIRIDRGKLPYLSLYRKVNCVYCGYANGLMNYWKAIGAMTEIYACPMKHKPKDFVAYGDEKAWVKTKGAKRFRK